MNHHPNGLINCGKPLPMLTTPTFVALNANQTPFFTTNPSFQMTTHHQPSIFQTPPGTGANSSGNRTTTTSFNPNIIPFGPQTVSFPGQNGLLFTSAPNVSQSSTFSPINLANLAATFAQNNNNNTTNKANVVTSAGPPLTSSPTINTAGINFTTKLSPNTLPILLPAQGQAIPFPMPPPKVQQEPVQKPVPTIKTEDHHVNLNVDQDPPQVPTSTVTTPANIVDEVKMTKTPTPPPPRPVQSSKQVEERPPATHRFTTKIEDDPDEVVKYGEDVLEKSEYFKNRILECIDKLKERKARPDMERIGCLMKRQFNVPHKITHRCLERLAEVGSIVCVDYKGHISYRNPAKWRRTSISNGVTNPTHISKLLVDSLRSLCEKYKDRTAFTLTEIEHMLLSMEKVPMDPNECHSVEEFNEQRRTFYDQFMPSLRLCVEREVLTGGLNKNIEGKYIIDESGDKKRAYAALLFNKKSIPKSMLGRPRTSAIPSSTRPLLKTYGPNLPSSTATVPSPSSMNNMKPIASKPPVSVNNSNNTNNNNNNGILFVTQKDANPTTTNVSVKPANGPRRGRPTNKMRAKMLEENGGITETKIKPILPNTCQNTTSTVFTTLSLNQNGIYQQTFFPKSITPANGQQQQQQQQQQQPLITNINKIPTSAEIKKSIPFIPKSTDKCFKCNESFKESEEPFTALQCIDCKKNAHSICLDFWPELTKRASECGWQCHECKRCAICRDSNKNDLKICDNCDQAFHYKCHKPVIDDDSDKADAWVCSLCLNAGFSLDVTGSSQMQLNGTEEKLNEVGCNSDKENNYPVIHSVMPSCGSTTSNNIPEVNQKKRSSAPLTETKTDNKTAEFEKTVQPAPSKICKIEEVSSVVVPPKKEEEKIELPKEVKDWSVKHVEYWLKNQGYTKEADSFCNEEIDGACLLLMKKMDILTDLGIKLGPAVKIFEKIKSLQSAR